jgi:hypothetical protein
VTSYQVVHDASDPRCATAEIAALPCGRRVADIRAALPTDWLRTRLARAAFLWPASSRTIAGWLIMPVSRRTCMKGLKIGLLRLASLGGETVVVRNDACR